MSRPTIKVSTGYVPNVLQRQIHDGMKRYNVIVCHRRFGKTVVAINSLLDAALRCTKVNGRFAYIAPFRKQAKDIAWDYLKLYGLRIPGAKANESELRLDLPNGARIALFGADDPDTFRGQYFDGVVLDEVAQMKPSVWGEVIRPAISDRKGWVIFIGTPKGINLLHKLFHDNLANPDWFVKMYPIADTLKHLAWLDEEEVEAARAAVSDAQARQEWDCDWSASSDDTLITVDMVQRAIDKHLREDDYVFAPVVLGVDPARFGDDRASIVCRQGLRMFEPLIFKGLDNVALAEKVIQEMTKRRADAVFVDGGRGEGVIDYCRRLGYHVVEVAFGGKARDQKHYHDRRSEMWCEMGEWLDAGGCLPRSQELIADLVVPTYSYDEQGRRHLESKKMMKTRVSYSPDVGDAAALTFAVPVRAKSGIAFDAHGRMVRQGPVSHTNDTYDPLR